MNDIQRILWIKQWAISKCCNIKYNDKTAWWFIWKKLIINI